MRAAILVFVVAIGAIVSAGPRKVIVLPVDGNADAATKAKLNDVVQDLAKSMPGDITHGDATFNETAVALGCDPNRNACIDNVLETLAVDEIVWGTATTADGRTTIVVRRATKGSPAHEQTAIIASTDEPETSETQLAPLFGVTSVAPGPGSEVGSGSAVEAIGSAVETTGSAAPPLPPPAPAPWSQRKKLGVGLAVGGAALVIVGFAMWASESSVQSDIDAAPNSTAEDIQHLEDLEDRANGYAWGGNIAMLLGLGAGGYGAYLLWQDHRETTTLTPAPPPSGTGMTFVLRGRW
jgi:hypothetical protein